MAKCFLQGEGDRKLKRWGSKGESIRSEMFPFSSKSGGNIIGLPNICRIIKETCTESCFCVYACVCVRVCMCVCARSWMTSLSCVFQGMYRWCGSVWKRQIEWQSDKFMSGSSSCPTVASSGVMSKLHVSLDLYHCVCVFSLRTCVWSGTCTSWGTFTWRVRTTPRRRTHCCFTPACSR